MLKKTLATLALALTSVFAHADEALIARPEVRDYLNVIATEHGFDETQLVDIFSKIEPKPHILQIFDRPSTSRPWHEFRGNYIDPRRINAGAAFWLANEKVLDEISQAYQVDPAIIVSILNVETMYGRNTGSFRVLDVLATTAFDYPRRAEFFRKELTEFLLLARDEKQDPLSFRGSYAGAMGWPQFMPSSFRAYAVDWDGDGRHDIWNTPADAMASVASYMALHGWQAGGDTMLPVTVEGKEIDGLVADKFNLHYSVAELMAKGVSLSGSIDTAQSAILFPLEMAPGDTRYFLGFKNFYAITRYNKSTLYATAVLELAEAIRTAKANGPIEPAKPAAPTQAQAKKKVEKKVAAKRTTKKKSH